MATPQEQWTEDDFCDCGALLDADGNCPYCTYTPEGYRVVHEYAPDFWVGEPDETEKIPAGLTDEEVRCYLLGHELEEIAETNEGHRVCFCLCCDKQFILPKENEEQ